MSEKMTELRAMSLADLKTASMAVLKELLKLRFQRSMGEMTQVHRFSALRRERARLLTVINEKGREQ
jgi:large subunit ribosomal protein L29